MSLTNKNVKFGILFALSLSMLFFGMSSAIPATANQGMPQRISNAHVTGEFGQRINMLPCLFGPCTITISSSESSWIRHGWSAGVAELGDGQPLTFEFFLNGQEVPLRRFAIKGNQDPHVTRFLFYQIFDAGTFPVGTHTVTGVWTAEKGQTVFVGTGPLVVTP